MSKYFKRFQHTSWSLPAFLSATPSSSHHRRFPLKSLALTYGTENFKRTKTPSTARWTGGLANINLALHDWDAALQAAQELGEKNHVLSVRWLLHIWLLHIFYWVTVPFLELFWGLLYHVISGYSIDAKCGRRRWSSFDPCNFHCWRQQHCCWNLVPTLEHKISKGARSWVAKCSHVGPTMWRWKGGVIEA